MSLTDRLTSILAGHYLIERELGQGGMATVYLAEDVRHRRKVAIKVLHPELSAVLGSERFLKEIELTANLQHPNILPLFDSGTADGLLYYVMPFVEGETLRARMERERQLPVSDAIRIATESAEALDYAHKRHIVHRDIKPENILLQAGRPLIADFGIALAVHQAGGNRMTQTGLSLGTPQYMSPEQATGERDIDARSDIYSLAAVTYEMLTGEPPFTGPSSQAIVAKVITTDPQRIVTKRRSVPPHVDSAVLKALEKMPADRFTSAAEFAHALGDAAFTRPSQTRTASAALRSRELPWREIALGATALAMISTATGGWLLLRPRPSPAVSRFTVSLDQNFITQTADVPAVSPDGNYFAYANAEGTLVLRQRDALRATPIEGAANGWGPFFSPDSRTLGFFTGFPGALRTVPLAGGTVTTLVPDSAYGSGGSWSDDDWIYFTGFVNGRIGVLRIRPDGGKPQVIALPDSTRDELLFAWPSALPGGKAVLVNVTRRKGAPDIAAIDVGSGTVRVLARGLRSLFAESGHLVTILGNGSVTATRFDPRRLRFDGKPAVVLTGVRTGAQGRAPFAFSRDGTVLYESYQPVMQVIRIEKDGRSQPVEAAWTGEFEHVAVSPDGRRLAVSVDQPDARTELWVKNLDGGTFTRLTGEGTYNYRPSWTPDGRSVLFVSDRSGRGELYQVPADGSAPATLLLSNPRGVDEGVWSNDGRWIAMRIGSGGGRDIAVKAAAADSDLRMLIASDAQEFSPTISPDGRWIAFSSDESGGFSEVYVRPFPDARAAKWQISRGGGSEPVWSPAGRELFYRNVRSELVAAQFESAPTFRVTDQRLLFNVKDYMSDSRNRAYSVAPDGKSFYFISVLPGASSELVVVLNWFEELKAKVGR